MKSTLRINRIKHFPFLTKPSWRQFFCVCLILFFLIGMLHIGSLPARASMQMLSASGILQNYSPDYIGEIQRDNEWQIVSQKYVGNEHSHKIAADSQKTSEVYLQKNVVSTEIENEFLVYLSVDKKMTYETFFDESHFWLTTANGYHDSMGKIVNKINGNWTEVYDAKQLSGDRQYTVLVYVYDNAKNKTLLYTYESVRYGTSPNCSNGTLLIQVPGVTGYIVAQPSVSLGGPNGNELTMQLYLDEFNMDFSSMDIIFDEVTDVMGENIQFLNLVACDGESTFDEKNNTLTWKPKDNDDVISNIDYGPPISGYEQNIIQLVYRVRLDVTKDGFYSAASNLNSSNNDPQSYPVNQEAILKYHKQPLPGSAGKEETGLSTLFPVPKVRGLLYNIPIIKTTETGDLLQGARFGLYDEKGNLLGYATSNDKGTLKFCNLPYGTYILKELEAPLGYIMDKSEKRILCSYTTNAGSLVVDPEQPENMSFRNQQNEIIKVENQSNFGSLSLQKLVASNDDKVKDKTYKLKVSLLYEGKPLYGEFKVTKESVKKESFIVVFDESGTADVELNDNEKITIDRIPVGTTYSVQEQEESSEGFWVNYKNRSGIIKRNIISECTVTNTRYIATLDIHKVDKEGNPIHDTEFTLYHASVSSDGKWDINEDKERWVVVTDEKGNAQISELLTGMYLLYETRAANGFYPSQYPWKVIVDEQGNIMVTTMQDETVFNSTEGYVIANYSIHVLPQTGGNVILWYTIAGILLISGVAFVLIKNVLNKENIHSTFISEERERRKK